MKNILSSLSFLLYTVILFTWGCSDSELRTPLSSTYQEQNEGISEKSPVGDRGPIQIRGYVTFQDGSPPRGNPEIYCYYQSQLKRTDRIDNNGLYVFTGPDWDWPTGNYFVQTQIIWVRDKRYSGEKWVYHVQGTPNWNEDITLYEIVRGSP